MQFSANLGFLWANLPLPDAIRAAHRAGFDAVECHWPYDTPPEVVKKVLDETALPMVGLNTRRGDPGENGLSAVPGREQDARASIDQALAYAVAIGARGVHVMAGIASGVEAEATFRANLTYACEKAGPLGLTILIEPLNPYDAPGYFLSDADHAAQIIGSLDRPNLKMMFDCYHLQICGGDICRRFERLMPLIGHVQIAAVPDRTSPDHGELDFRYVLSRMGELGWPAPIGAEYRPGRATEETLAWLPGFRDIPVKKRPSAG